MLARPLVRLVVCATLVIGGFGAGTLGAQSTLRVAIGGDGSDGAFNPTANVTLNTDTLALFQFKSMRIGANITVRCIGKKPIFFKVQGQVVIDGTLDCSGLQGGSGGNNQPGGKGGVPGAGGGPGGQAGIPPTNLFQPSGLPGLPGFSAQVSTGGGGGKDGGMPGGSFTDPVGGGGGGGNAVAGSNGSGRSNTGRKHAFSGAGGPANRCCRAGNGGGGGGGDLDSTTNAVANDGGGGGGGGGGWVTISALAGIQINVSGKILANGGAGGTSTGNGGGGGGGAGGMIDLLAPRLTNNGTLSAVGGAAGMATQGNCGCSPGGKGGDGCINGYALGPIMGRGTSMPGLAKKPFAPIVNGAGPSLSIFVSSRTASDRYFTGLGLACQKPPIQTPWGLLRIPPADPLFALTLGLKSAPPVFTGLSGTGATATITASFSNRFFCDLEIFLQAATLNQAMTAVTGLSNKVSVLFKF